VNLGAGSPINCAFARSFPDAGPTDAVVVDLVVGCQFDVARRFG
jgi:hypothetical protein